MTEELNNNGLYESTFSEEESILALTAFVGQTPSDNLLGTVMKNADNTVKSRLARHSLPIPDSIPEILKTAANYYAVSDLLQAIYGKDDRSTNEQGFYTKAENLMNDYIEQQLVELERTEGNELEQALSPYGFSQSPDAFELGLLHR